MPQLLDAISQRRGLVAGNGEGEVIQPGLVGCWDVQLAATQQSSKDRQYLDIQQVGGVDVTTQSVQQLFIRGAPDEGLDHGRGVDNDHRRSAWTAATS